MDDCRHWNEIRTTEVDCLHWLEDAEFRRFASGELHDPPANAVHGGSRAA